MEDSFRILLLEDDRFTHKAIERALSEKKYKCIAVETLNEALDKVKKEPFDLIISDVSLPDGTGLEFLDAVQSYLYDIPFVIITASDNKQLIQQAIQKGAYDFLTKPFNLDNLPTVVERNIERKKFELKTKNPLKVSVLMKTIQALIAALEAKDSYTSGHSLRVARYSRMLGGALGLDERELFTLELASLLHDIGKIGMPDNILKKTSSLHDAEYIMAKKHTVVGSEIVGKIDELKEVAAIIRHHHERFDGQGYPDGLSGKVIPLHARILSIADSYETLISERIYSPATPPDEAMEEIRKSAGTQFDPELVDIFLELLQSAETPATPLLEIERHNGTLA
jgi:putative two-component system response regulator